MTHVFHRIVGPVENLKEVGREIALTMLMLADRRGATKLGSADVYILGCCNRAWCAERRTVLHDADTLLRKFADLRELVDRNISKLVLTDIKIEIVHVKEGVVILSDGKGGGSSLNSAEGLLARILELAAYVQCLRVHPSNEEGARAAAGIVRQQFVASVSK